MRSFWWRMWPLAALSIAVMVAAAVGVLPTWPGLPHLLALPPLDVFTDLRVFLVRASSWPGFLLALVAVLTVRITLLAHLLGGLNRSRFWLAARFYAILIGPVFLIAFFVAAAYAVLYSRFFWGGLTVLALLTVALLAAPWSSQGGSLARSLRDLWRRHGLRVEVVVPYLLAVIAIGVVGEVMSAAVIALVPVSALATAMAIRALERPPLRRPWVALGAVGGAVALLASAIVITGRPGEQPGDGPPQEGSLVLMSGINSSSGVGAILEVEPAQLGFTCDQTYYISYAGAGGGQPQNNARCPIRTGAPYEPEDTQRPFDEQVEAFAAQVNEFPPPVTVATHSHGVWVAWEAVASGQAEVEVLILVGPFPDSVIGYPEPGQTAPGRVFGDLLRVAAPVADLVDFHFDPNAPASRQLLAVSNISRDILSQPLPATIRAISITSVVDVVLMPGGWELDVERNACPVRTAHPDLPMASSFVEEVTRFLEGESAPSCPSWRDWGSLAARPFGVPPADG